MTVNVHSPARTEPDRTQPLLVGSTLFPARLAPRLLRGWRDHTRTAPATITTSFRLLRLPAHRAVPPSLAGEPVVCVDGVSVDLEAVRRLEARLGYLARPLAGGWGPVSRARTIALGERQSVSEREGGGGGAIGDGLRLRRLDDWAIEAFLRLGRDCAALRCAELRHRGGTTEYLLAVAGIPGAPAARRVLDAQLDRMLTALSLWSAQPRVVRVAARSDAFADRMTDALLARLGRDRAVAIPELVLVD